MSRATVTTANIDGRVNIPIYYTLVYTGYIPVYTVCVFGQVRDALVRLRSTRGEGNTDGQTTAAPERADRERSSKGPHERSSVSDERRQQALALGACWWVHGDCEKYTEHVHEKPAGHARHRHAEVEAAYLAAQ